MKYLFVYAVALLLCSCNQEKENNNGSYLTLEIDTVMVDYQKMYEEISFSTPVWDMDNERYYRLSYQIAFKKEKAADSPIPEVAHMYLFFSTYDKNFELIGEVAVPGSLKTISKYFVREGMLWLKVNIDDELGFIRMKPNLLEDNVR